MNDFNEQTEGIEIIRAVFGNDYNPLLNSCIDQRTTSLRTFVGSFSRDENKLSQWRGYCPKDGGYCIEFELPDVSDELYACVYKDTDKKELSEKLLREVADFYSESTHGKNEQIRLRVWRTISTFKNEGFFEESEHRLLKACWTNSKDLKFRTKGNTIIPYVEYEIKPEFINSIRIGPCANTNLAKDGLELLIEHLHFTKGFFETSAPEIKVSNITLRP
ncbi:DUF2971 domain-containing protein [Thiocystis violascens]|nr:DUF2971 domain-containing protein [Thiocystis violascens]